MRQTGTVLPSEQLHRPSGATQFVTLLALLSISLHSIRYIAFRFFHSVKCRLIKFRLAAIKHSETISKYKRLWIIKALVSFDVDA